MTVDRNGLRHQPGGRPDGGRFARKTGRGSDDDLTMPARHGTRTHEEDVRSAAFLHRLDSMMAEGRVDEARDWARKAGVIMDGRDLPYAQGHYAVWTRDGVSFVDVGPGGRATEAPFDPGLLDPPADWNGDA